MMVSEYLYHANGPESITTRRSRVTMAGGDKQINWMLNSSATKVTGTSSPRPGKASPKYSVGSVVNQW